MFLIFKKLYKNYSFILDFATKDEKIRIVEHPGESYDVGKAINREVKE